MTDERNEIEKVSNRDDIAIIRTAYPVSAEGYDAYGYGAESGGQVHLGELWRVIRKRLWLIIAIFLVATVATTIEMYRKQEVYSASAAVEIEKNSYKQLDPKDGMPLFEDSDLSSPSILKTKMFIIKSDPLLEDVVVDLKLDQDPQFIGALRKRTVSEAVDVLMGKGPAQEESKVVVPPPGPVDLTQRVVRSREPQESERLEPYVNVLRNWLTVEQVPNTQVLSISFTHPDRNIAAAVANSVADHFIRRSYKTKIEKFTNMSGWLERTTVELQDKVKEAEQALANYSRDNNIYSTEGMDNLAISKLVNLHGQVQRAETDRLIKQSLYQEVQAGRLEQLTEVFSDQRIGELTKRLSDLRVQSAQLNAIYGPENPKVVDVENQIEAIKGEIAASRRALEAKLKADYERAVRDERELKQALEEAKAGATTQNQLAIQFNILKQNLDTARSLYKEFLQKNTQVQVQLQEQENNIRVIQRAKLPKGPIGPNRTPVILAASIVSLLVGIGLVFLFEYLDRTVKTVSELNRFTQLPALGVIPAANKKLLAKAKKKGSALTTLGVNGNGSPMMLNGLFVLDYNSPIAEAYRGLRTSVLLTSSGAPPKTILVTSGLAAEGKTTTAVNTAISLAQLGMSVLVIDCDLRKPAVDKVLGLEAGEGLSTYLSVEGMAEPPIQQSFIPNLYVLPCGPIPSHPAELISSRRMKEMIRTLSERFDYIIVDSPPLMHVTDPVILSTMVDGVILVVHSGKSTRDIIRQSCQELSNVGAKNFGVVLNNIDLRRGGSNSIYHYRYYHSGADR
ncbi:MAG TPA: polysaccharide biosynthesis tyrosine autokinase [Blastocatellia bacterium]|nr:polysaccharide biosynthesis tyrosine autokinase [Blastocatellia bacterium]